MKRILITAVASGAALLGTAAVAAPAMAGTGPASVTAVTHSASHPDTTSVSGPATLSSPGGPVWAFDNSSYRFVVTPETGPGNYLVTIYDNGQFQGFADPNTGQALVGNGSVKGTISYDVQSATPPDPANLPAQEPGAATQDQAGIDGGYTRLGGMISQLFDGQPTSGPESIIVGYGPYNFTYTLMNGEKYVQTG